MEGGYLDSKVYRYGILTVSVENVERVDAQSRHDDDGVFLVPQDAGRVGVGTARMACGPGDVDDDYLCLGVEEEEEVVVTVNRCNSQQGPVRYS